MRYEGPTVKDELIAMMKTELKLLPKQPTPEEYIELLLKVIDEHKFKIAKRSI